MENEIEMLIDVIGDAEDWYCDLRDENEYNDEMYEKYDDIVSRCIFIKNEIEELLEEIENVEE